MGQEMCQAPASSCLGGVGPEEIAELLARDGARLTCEAIEQRPRLAARERKRRLAVLHQRRPQQRDPQLSRYRLTVGFGNRKHHHELRTACVRMWPCAPSIALLSSAARGLDVRRVSARRRLVIVNKIIG